MLSEGRCVGGAENLIRLGGAFTVTQESLKQELLRRLWRLQVQN